VTPTCRRTPAPRRRSHTTPGGTGTARNTADPEYFG